MRRIERLRWRIATLIDKLPGQCWADLADWPLGNRRVPWAPQRAECREDAERLGGCYCGKLRKPGGGQPTPAEPFPQPPQLPGGPCVDDPTGLRYDRADLDDTPETLRAAEGWSVTGRGPNAVQLKTCCDGVAGDVCDCSEMLRQLAAAPVFALPPIRPRDLHRLTVAEVERIKRGAA